jgi:recombination protein RecT
MNEQSKATGMEVTPYARFGTVLQMHYKQLCSILPEGMDPARFTRTALNLIQKDRTGKLAQCTPSSFALSVMAAAELGLELLLGMAYIIPYRNKKKQNVMEANFQIGYQGMIELARRSGRVHDIWAEVVREGDEFDVLHGTTKTIRHVKTAPEEAPLSHVYACAVLAGSPVITSVVLTRRDVERRKAVSKTATYEDSFWTSWEEEMWKKTAIRALYKLLPKSTKMILAETADNQLEDGEQVRPQTIDLEGFAASMPAPEPWDTAPPDPAKVAEEKAAPKGKGGLV